MAPALTSNSFLLNTTPHSRLSLKNPGLRVFAKKAGPFSTFQFGQPKDDGSSSEGSQTDGSGNSSPFNFNFGKVPDMKSLVPVVSKPSSGLSFGNIRRKDPGTVFVAGATGQAGIRIAQTLLREGFSVRAGVPQLGAAQELARLAALYKIISNEESKRLNAVESTFQDTESIAKAIGNASKAVVTIGPTENGPTSEVSTLDALQVVEAAQLAGVGHVAIIYDGNPASASTYNVLDGFKTFFNNLFSQSQLPVPEFLQKVIETDVSYTFIKTSLTEDFSPESSYNVVVSAEGSTGTDDFKVAKSQIASVVANVFSNTSVAENKFLHTTHKFFHGKVINRLEAELSISHFMKCYRTLTDYRITCKLLLLHVFGIRLWKFSLIHRHHQNLWTSFSVPFLKMEEEKSMQKLLQRQKQRKRQG
nr:protein PLASTID TRANSCRIPTIONALLY ACTIVE 16, chloroplastic-like isoform X2 [Populus alba]